MMADNDAAVVRMSSDLARIKVLRIGHGRQKSLLCAATLPVKGPRRQAGRGVRARSAGVPPAPSLARCFSARCLFEECGRDARAPLLIRLPLRDVHDHAREQVEPWLDRIEV